MLKQTKVWGTAGRKIIGNNLYIGNYKVNDASAVAGFALNGSVDELIIYNRTITQTEMFSNYLNYYEYSIVPSMGTIVEATNNNKTISFITNNYSIGTTSNVEEGYYFNVTATNITINCQGSYIYGNYTDKQHHFCISNSIQRCKTIKRKTLTCEQRRDRHNI